MRGGFMSIKCKIRNNIKKYALSVLLCINFRYMMHIYELKKKPKTVKHLNAIILNLKNQMFIDAAAAFILRLLYCYC